VASIQPAVVHRRHEDATRNHCQEDHQSWPAKGRYTRHTAEASRQRRMNTFAADAGAVKLLHGQIQSQRLRLIDLDTGEIKDL
jgi:hypothetical protein